ncbi:TadA family conjugal transfer-associated ATPase [Mobilicoccus sp.]|uniref:TadA family conjugal transfer-associated ATPase n=1 Tax=Mobilicoccus sp. TaxID=2034349 RepID=UPI00289FE723|nr:TadA family conjugal transfer-associated ATPase [Mobilicoccus sp.]
MTTAAVWDHIRRGRGPTPVRVAGAVGEDSAVLGTAGAARRVSSIEDALLGSGPLADLVEDPEVTDVLVNGTDGVWIDRGAGLTRVQVHVGDATDLRRLAVRLAGSAGRRLDDASPFVDGLLPGGVRLHALLPPLVDGAAHISLRIPRSHAPTLAALEQWGACTPSMAGVLRALVARRCAFLVTGGTGSGKSTLLAALLAEVNADERIVLVEDVKELTVRHPHVVSLQARQPNVEGRGAVDLATLVRQSLRMRPDRVAVGEVRGAEVQDMLTALNTGHEGGCGTVHANAPTDVVARMEALGALAGMSPPATLSQVASALQVVVHMHREGGARVVQSIGVFDDGARGLCVVPALVRDRAGGYRVEGGHDRLVDLLETKRMEGSEGLEERGGAAVPPHHGGPEGSGRPGRSAGLGRQGQDGESAPPRPGDPPQPPRPPAKDGRQAPPGTPAPSRRPTGDGRVARDRRPLREPSSWRSEVER